MGLADGEFDPDIAPAHRRGDEGKLYAVAISPDGTEVAVGGYTGRDYSDDFHVYFFETLSGRLIRQIDRLPNVVLHLAYSSDGSHLAVALWGPNGIRVYRTADLKQVGSDDAYADDSYWVEFDRGGRLLSTSFDGFIRLYDADFHCIKKQMLAAGSRPFSARFSPEGKKIAVGFDDSTAVNVLDSDSLDLLHAPDTQDINKGNLGAVAWSEDGHALYAGGRYRDKTSTPLIRWSDAGLGACIELPANNYTVMDIRCLSQNRLVYGTFDPTWGLMDDSGFKLIEKKPLIIDHRKSSTDKLKLSSDGLSVEFMGNQNKPRLFSLAGQREAEDLNAAKIDAQGLDITDWLDQTSPKLNGKPLALDDYEISRSLAIAQDENHFLLGTEWRLRFYDRQGHELWNTPAPGIAWAVNISRDQRFAVAAFADGTIRWFDLENGLERFAYFPCAETDDWVLWTPEGFFDASENGKELIGYHLNQGEAKEGRFVSVNQLYDLFYRPDLIAKRAEGDEEAILHALAKIGAVNHVLASGLPPRIELLSEPESIQQSTEYVLDFKLTDQGGGIGQLVYKVNGTVLDARPVDIARPGPGRISRSLFVSPGKNIIEVSAYNEKGQIESLSQKVCVTVDLPEQQSVLHVLALGVKDYVDSDLNLKFADQDALDIAAKLETSGRNLFKSIRVKTLVNQQATLINIIAAFTEFAASVQPEDVFVLFMAGHGKNLDGDYHFIPHELRYKNDDVIRAGSLSQEKLNELLPKIKAQKSVILLDTCDSGSFKLARGLDQKTAIARLMKATGRAVLAATGEKELAYESEHGLFTTALLEGLSKAGQIEDKMIGVKALALYVEERVPELSKQKFGGLEQIPMSNVQEIKQDFPIGLRP